jgi:hypothetical protein
MKMTLSAAERERRRQHRARITTREVHAAGGRAAAALNIKNRTAIFGLSRDQRVENASNGGLVGGRKTAESGKLSAVGRGIKTAESLAKGGRAACHVRHHVNRNRFSPRCELCSEQNFVFAFA